MAYLHTGLNSVFGISRKQMFWFLEQVKDLIKVGIKIMSCFMMHGLMKVLSHSNNR